MGFLADIIRSIASMFTQVLETELKSLLKIIETHCYNMIWVTFAMLLMLLGTIFTVFGVHTVLRPLVGHGPAAVIVGAITILAGIIIYCKITYCFRK